MVYSFLNLDTWGADVYVYHQEVAGDSIDDYGPAVPSLAYSHVLKGYLGSVRRMWREDADGVKESSLLVLLFDPCAAEVLRDGDQFVVDGLRYEGIGNASSWNVVLPDGTINHVRVPVRVVS